MTIDFRPFTTQDLPLYYKWAQIPHVKNTWFLEGYQPVEAIEEKLRGNGYDYPFIITLDKSPIGFIQYCDLTTYQALASKQVGVFCDAPQGSACVDLFIAEEKCLNKGYGTTIMKRFCDWLLHHKQYNPILIDPSVKNTRALHCYRKAGFYPIRVQHDGIMDAFVLEYQKPLCIGVAKELKLVTLTPEDAQAHYEAIHYNRNYLRKFLSWVDNTHSKDDTKKFIEKYLKNFFSLKGALFAIVAKEDIIGSVGIDFSPSSPSEIGYWIAEDRRGQGVMTKSVQALMEYFSKNFQTKDFIIKSAKQNDRSKLLAKRLGFSLKGEEEKAAYHNGNRITAEVYYKKFS